jgi:hypothetical protein
VAHHVVQGVGIEHDVWQVTTVPSALFAAVALTAARSYDQTGIGLDHGNRHDRC